MAIHRWGEGVWARTTALAVVALFVIWGAAALYGAPAGLSVIVERGELLTEEKWEGLIGYTADGGPGTIQVNWVDAQPIGDGLENRIAADDVVKPGRQAIVKSGETITKEMIGFLRDAGFNSIPIQGENRQKVEERIVGVCVLAERVGSVKPVELIAKDTVVSDGPGDDPTEVDIKRIRELLLLAVPPLGTREEGKGPKVHRLDPADGQIKVAEIRQVQGDGSVEVGDKFITPVMGQEDNTIAEENTLIDQALYLKLKEQGILEVQVKTDARLPVSPDTKAKLLGWHVEAGETVERETFWTKPLFIIPGLDWPFDGGVLICLIVAVVLLALGWRYCNRPNVVDHLIETQNEMKKVSWPGRKELVGSSMVVIVFIAVVATILFVSDVAFAALAKLIGIYPEGL